LLFTVTVISDNNENEKLSPLKTLEVVITFPAFNVSDTGFVEKLVVSTKNDIFVIADFLDLGTYPMFLARETTFSLSVALSMNTSFDTILALYEVIYVLYAKISMIDDRFDPSKS
jgi:hypothetical protein